MSVTNDWFSEGNVVASVARHLVKNDWKVLTMADTRSRERGADIHAARDGWELFIEVKGYPSRFYRDERRAGEAKPTNPTNQAQQWYSHALLKAFRLQTSHPRAKVALAFPDFPRYRKLSAETRIALNKLGIALFFVAEAGLIEELK